jgi:FlaA1/EpsC-like NDP-sugar epimerase
MSEFKNILIIGAGKAGKLLFEDIEKNHAGCKVIGFIDDTKKEDGAKVLGTIEDLSKINKIYKVDEMIISIPSADGGLVRRILKNNLKNRVSIKIVPRNQRIISLSDVKYCEIKDLDLEDFLGRPFTNKNVEKLKKYYRDKTVFITGGAGSIGSEIVRQLIDLGAKNVIVYDNSEYLIFNLDQSLREKGIRNKCKLTIGNILNKEKLNLVIKREKPDLIFHAAAYKHVYLMEDNIDEAVLNNVIGTKNVIDAAISNRISQFTFISTDKVVNPTSIMGATKKLCEYYIKCLDSRVTKFNIVRFGNVINSNGSVLPLFERQIENNKYVTVTHKKIRRFFMSIREAAQLVIESTAGNSKNSIHILDMGELIKIYEIAECLIRSKNLMPMEDIAIKITGLRKGEKMIEELYTGKEKDSVECAKTKNIMTLKNFEKCDLDIEKVFNDLASETDNYSSFMKDNLKKYLKKIFPSLKIK